MNGKDVVRVYLENVNYLGQVTDRNMIAEFRTMNWAKDFIEKVTEQFKDDKYWNVKVEVGENAVETKRRNR